MNFKNSKKQGDAGLGSAISWFTGLGYTVSLPLTDSQDYDLIVDNGEVLERVQVKTTTYIRNRSYVVSLTVSGGNRSWKGNIKKLDPSKVDSLFVLTSNGDRYYIPVTAFEARGSLNLIKYEKFKIRE